MKTAEIHFLSQANLLSPSSGALITFNSIDRTEKLDSRCVAKLMSCLPTSLRLSQFDLEAPLATQITSLMMALSEHARLQPSSARLLLQNDTSLQIWLPVDDRRAAEAAAALCCHVLKSVSQNDLPNITTSQLWAALRSSFWNQTHAHLARAAQELEVPFYRLERSGKQFLQLGQGRRLRLCHETLTDQTPLFARSATNKETLHRLLRHRGVPLPAQQAVETLEQALTAANTIGWPVVLKPCIGAKGQGVWVGLSDPKALRQAWEAQGGRTRQLVQQTLCGADHRLLVMEGRLLATAQRQPAALISDGLQTLQQQIDALNADPERGVSYERLLNRVQVDARLTLLLSEQGFTLDSVPPTNINVQLSRTSNISQGGTANDCSERVHPDNRRLAEDIAKLIGADVVGLDLISNDIGVSWREGGTWLLEANLSPGLRPHLVANPKSDLCQRLVRAWVGDGPRAGRIPTAAITGSIGKTTTSRILAHLLQRSGLRVGLCSSTGMELDGEILVNGDLSGGGPALQLLQDRRVEALVAEMARGGVLKSGVGLERLDAVAVLNVLDNHIGADGIRNRDGLARIKGLVAEAAEGLLVLNANDPLVMAMARQREPEALALVAAADDPPPAWLDQRAGGHRAASYSMHRTGMIELHWQGETTLSLPLRVIPASDDGCIDTMAPAAAFAACLAHGLGMDAEQIEAGLRSFGLKQGHQRGRFEVLVQEPWQVVLTWGDGPEAIRSLARYAISKTEEFSSGRRVLLLTAPDTRTDAFLKQVGQSCQGFDLVITAAWFERRGREPHEVPALLAEGIRSLGQQGPAVIELGVETEAVASLAKLLQPEDFCVVCSFTTELMREVLLNALGSGQKIA